MIGDLHLTNEQRKKKLKETNDKNIKHLLEFTDLICELEKIMNKDEYYFTKQIKKEEIVYIINDKINNIKSLSKINENEIEQIGQKEFYQIYLKICEIEQNMIDIIKIKFNIK